MTAAPGVMVEVVVQQAAAEEVQPAVLATAVRAVTPPVQLVVQAARVVLPAAVMAEPGDHLPAAWGQLVRSQAVEVVELIKLLAPKMGAMAEMAKLR
jgi:hypothetical protein